MEYFKHRYATIAGSSVHYFTKQPVVLCITLQNRLLDFGFSVYSLCMAELFGDFPTLFEANTSTQPEYGKINISHVAFLVSRTCGVLFRFIVMLIDAKKNALTYVGFTTQSFFSFRETDWRFKSQVNCPRNWPKVVQ